MGSSQCGSNGRWPGSHAMVSSCGRVTWCGCRSGAACSAAWRRALSSPRVSLDRRAIEKRDFPARLRGYDRAAVDAHLRWIADELEARVGSTADMAADQVRAVLDAAERSAGEIVAGAEAEAQRVGSAAARAGDEATARVTAAAS